QLGGADLGVAEEGQPLDGPLAEVAGVEDAARGGDDVLLVPGDDVLGQGDQLLQVLVDLDHRVLQVGQELREAGDLQDAADQLRPFRAAVRPDAGGLAGLAPADDHAEQLAQDLLAVRADVRLERLLLLVGAGKAGARVALEAQVDDVDARAHVGGGAGVVGGEDPQEVVVAADVLVVAEPADADTRRQGQAFQAAAADAALAIIEEQHGQWRSRFDLGPEALGELVLVVAVVDQRRRLAVEDDAGGRRQERLADATLVAGDDIGRLAGLDLVVRQE